MPPGFIDYYLNRFTSEAWYHNQSESLTRQDLKGALYLHWSYGVKILADTRVSACPSCCHWNIESERVKRYSALN